MSLLRKQLNFLSFQGRHQELEEPRAKQIEPFDQTQRWNGFFGGQKRGRKKTWKIIWNSMKVFKYLLGDAVMPPNLSSIQS